MVKKDTKKLSIKDRIIDSALTLAATRNWGDIDFDTIIGHANCDRKDVLEYFDDKGDILILLGRRIDRQMIEEANLESEIDTGNQDIIRERLFDLLMARFDILSEHRAAILSILDGIKFDPKQAIVTLPHLTKSMARVLEEAGDSTDGFMGCAKITGLTAVYLYAVKAWREDDTADMAKTMAALDKALGLAEEASNSLSGGDIFGLFSNVKDRFSKD